MQTVPSLALLASQSEHPLRAFEKGTVLIEEGPGTGRLYVLESGEIEIVKGDVVVARISEPGAIFGEISALLDLGHSATVRSASPVSVYEIIDAVQFLEESPAMMANVAKLLARRLVDATTYLTDLKQQYADREDHFAMVDQVLEALVNQQDAQLSPSAPRTGDSRLDDGAP